MIDPNHKLPVVRQTRLLSLARSTAYYQPRPIPVEDLELMRQIDRLHLEHPFAGARLLRDFRNRPGNPSCARLISQPVPQRYRLRRLCLDVVEADPDKSSSRRQPKAPLELLS
jgi:hypothetical protein